MGKEEFTDIINCLNVSECFDIKNISILDQAEQFFKYVCEKSQSAKNVLLSCLTIDEKGRGRDLLQILEQRIKNKQNTRIFLDKSRSMRNRSFIKELKERNLFDSVKFIDKTSLKILPHILNEAISVYHDKIYIFDHEVCLSGANLGRVYFSNRIDRYWIIKDKNFAESMAKKIFSQQIALAADNSLKICDKLNFQKLKGLETRNKSIGASPPTTKIFYFSETHENKIFKILFKENHNEIFLSTPYINFPSHHIKLLQKHDVSIFISAPESRSFQNFGSFGKIINQIYTYSTLKTQEYLPKAKIHEFNRPRHSFHTKGIWIFNEDYAVSVIGSSNYNRRSSKADKEISWVAVTNDQVLIEKWRNEVRNLYRDSCLKPISEFRTRKVHLIAIILFFIFNKYI